MKLGTQTGSLTNHILSRSTIGAPEPEIGMGATILSWTDRHAATVIAVEKCKNGDTIVAVQEDNAKRTDSNGMSESQTYEYSPNLNGSLSHFRQKATGGSWQQVTKGETGRWKMIEGYGLQIGYRRTYYDFSF